ncbi:SDR family NAD(P)-dependent oxidoreductase [Alkalihalobacterium alkalinitrilicum]|uniref:SDR family NAD(P)-dependent oxidoreductase n=1 Tax=Alkalihalobacterium alkalinitrilicum TaxID=427920 RepID=UPI000995AB52|nr:glucose 1-dehydrogenase [Alkalihalobacterium alkalinitrilicum]
MKLKGKVAIITGGGSGQGRAAAELFAQEGAKVVVAEWNEAAGSEAVQEIKAQGRDALFIKLDVSKEDEVRAMVDQVVDHYGTIDILFNNAGIGYSARSKFKMEPVLETPLEDWNAILNINLTGVFLVSKYVLPIMIKQNSGNIINNSSLAGLKGGEVVCAYTVAKTGVTALTRVMSLSYGKNNIRVNCICPGAIDTPMMADHIDGMKERSSELWPLARVGVPKDIAQAALFLASDESSYITGVMLPVDGGWHQS